MLRGKGDRRWLRLLLATPLFALGASCRPMCEPAKNTEVCGLPRGFRDAALGCPGDRPRRVETPRAVFCLHEGEELTAEACASVAGGCGNELDRVRTATDRRRDDLVRPHGFRYGRCLGYAVGRLEPNQILEPSGNDDADRAIDEPYRSLRGVRGVGPSLCCPSAFFPASKACVALFVDDARPEALDILFRNAAAIEWADDRRPRLEIVVGAMKDELGSGARGPLSPSMPHVEWAARDPLRLLQLDPLERAADVRATKRDHDPVLAIGEILGERGETPGRLAEVH
jgi:hypothetical protein